MRHSYSELYVMDAQLQLATIFDYLTNVYNIKIKDFLTILSISQNLERLENGDPGLISGKSGVEIVDEYLYFFGQKKKNYNPSLSKSREYWLGYYLAYYQWYSGRRYFDIFRYVSIDEMLDMYHPYHEMDVMKFVEALDERIGQARGETKLKKYREYIGMSQSELSKSSGVSLRSIQLYEQRKNDIDKAQGHTLYKLARALRVSIEDLLEDPGIQK